MDLLEAIEARHSVRAYTDQPIGEDVRKQLQDEIDRCNAEGNLRIKLVCDEPEAFDSTLAHYGKFSNVRNYLVLAGAPAADLDERCGYYGERIVLLAQQLGLNTCWVALTFKKRYVKKMLEPGTKLSLVISIGHGVDDGRPHKSKGNADVGHVSTGEPAPEWFTRGIEAALLAPTAVNQQKFDITLLGETDTSGKPLVSIASLGGSYANVDLGIVRLHFEIGAGTESFAWKNPLKNES